MDYGNFDFIFDDESYFTLNNTTLAGNDRFYSSKKKITPDNVKYKYKTKYEPKMLCWIAISPKGMINPLFFQSGLAINQEVYREKWLKTCLVPFVKRNYRRVKYVFWPNLATSHYAKSCFIIIIITLSAV